MSSLFRTPNGYIIKTGTGEIYILAVDAITAETTALLNAAPLNSLAIAAANVFGSGPQAYYVKVNNSNVLVDDWVRLVSTQTLLQDIVDATEGSVNIDTLALAVTQLQTDVSGLTTSVSELENAALNSDPLHSTVTVQSTPTPFSNISAFARAVRSVDFLVSVESQIVEGPIRNDTYHVTLVGNGNNEADATSVSVCPWGIVTAGENDPVTGIEFSAALSGTGATQTMVLRIQKDAAVTGTVKASAAITGYTTYNDGISELSTLFNY